MAGAGSMKVAGRRRALGRLGFAALLPVLAPALGGCAVSRAARGLPGTDLSEVQAGRTRAQVEAVLGAPSREWSTLAGVRYRMYRYDAGQPGSQGDAAGLLFMDVISLGLTEVFSAADPTGWDIPVEQRMRTLAVSYGPDEVAIGVFRDVTEFERLPDDGRPAPATGAPPAR